MKELMMPFPPVTGKNLEGRKFSLPADFGSSYNIVLLAFVQEQQLQVDTWTAFLTALRRANANLSVYELPVLEPFSYIQRFMLDYWMRSGIPDSATRATTITLYLDTTAFIKSLDLPDMSTIYILLVDRNGVVYWRGSGSYSVEKGQQLAKAIRTRQGGLQLT
jgi:hypothetical protein